MRVIGRYAVSLKVNQGKLVLVGVSGPVNHQLDTPVRAVNWEKRIFTWPPLSRAILHGRHSRRPILGWKTGWKIQVHRVEASSQDIHKLGTCPHGSGSSSTPVECPVEWDPMVKSKTCHRAELTVYDHVQGIHTINLNPC